MEETGKGNKKWQEDIYWSHFNCIRFISHLSGDFQKQLAIPRKFASKLRKKLPDIVVLRGPSSSTWNVGLSIEDETLFFKDGWQEFVKDHSLEENDELVFQYNGESCVDVLIFDQSSLCEKESSYFVKRCICAASTDESNGPTKRKKVEDTVNNNDSEKEQRSVRETDLSHSRYLSNRRAVTQLEKNVVLWQAQALAAAKPESEMVVMQPTHVYVEFSLVISCKWMDKNISVVDKYLILRVKEKMWQLTLIHDTNLGTWLMFGWKEFALRNYLEESDVCVFDPAGRNQDGIVIVDVTIFRVVQEIVTPTGV
ncbi:hypothetical protein SLEP1_g16831 [Rubroshorea leprosula]|uniref:TF-B3 domain-containing protein n=1 Tax=Rubroshorea leprosula TaxID=152421 RepID=A0AAV5J1F1_9ROSI|nr:hypothetical protein SLEP1_g16831 [Rubroshorea leprosula]